METLSDRAFDNAMKIWAITAKTTPTYRSNFEQQFVDTAKAHFPALPAETVRAMYSAACKAHS